MYIAGGEALWEQEDAEGLSALAVCARGGWRAGLERLVSAACAGVDGLIKHTYTHSYMLAHMQTYMHTCIHEYMHTCILSHAHLYKCKYVYIYVCMCMYMCMYISI